MGSFLERIKLFAENSSESIAIVDRNGRRETNYEEFYNLVNKFAHYYKEIGLNRGDLVIIAADRCREYIAAQLGAWMTGCGFISETAKTPKDRLDAIRSKCGAKTVLKADTLEAVAIGLTLDDSILVELEDKEIAMVTVTAGTVLEPKCVAWSYETVINSMEEQFGKLWESDREDNFLVSVPMDSHISYLCSLAPLFNGNVLHIVNDKISGDAQAVAQYVADNSIQNIYLDAEVLSTFENTFDGLKCVVTGKGKLKGFEAKDYRVVSTYSLAEVGLALVNDISKGVTEDNVLGKVAGGYKAYLLDERGNEVEEGEICIAGAKASGYIADDEVGAVAFASNTLDSDEKLATLFKTNDIGIKDADGNIVYVDRKDLMFKIDGQRVDIDAVEEALKSIDGITDGVVKGDVDADGNKYLCAFYIADEVFTIAELEKAMTGKVEEFCVPKNYIKIDKLPVNAKGQIDKNMLVIPEIDASRAEYVEPKTDDEIKLCAAIEKVLNCGKVGLKDEFFKLGGNSDNIAEIMEKSGIASLTEYQMIVGGDVEGILKVKDSYKTAPEKVTTADRKKTPLSRAQMNIFGDSASRGTKKNDGLYLLLKLDAGIDLEKLQSATASVVEAHQGMLSHIIIDVDGEICQRRCENFEVTIDNISSIDSALPELIKPFNLFDANLSRIKIMQDVSGAKYFFVGAHRIILDENSMNIFLDAVGSAYNDGDVKAEIVSGKDMIYLEAVNDASECYADAKQYYSKLLADFAGNGSLTKNVTLDDTFASVERSFNELSLDKIEDYCKANKLTKRAVFDTAFAIVMGNFANSDEIVFAKDYSNRNDSKTENTIGVIDSSIAVRVAAKNGNVVEVARAVEQQIMTSELYSIYPFTDICTDCGISKDIRFNYTESAGKIENFCNAGCVQVIKNCDSTKAPFNMTVNVLGDKITVNADYRSDIYSADSVKEVISQLENVIASMMSNSEISEIAEQLPKAEVQMLDISVEEEVVVKPIKSTKTAEKIELDEKLDLKDVLKYNCAEHVDEIEYKKIGNVLLTGSTGFIGRYMLRELINSDCEKIYCLVDKGEFKSAKARLLATYEYFFGESCAEYIGSKVELIDGEIFVDNLSELLVDASFDTIINCATTRKESTIDNYFEEINVLGVKKLVELALERKVKLVQISTVGVAGEITDKKLHENELLIGQKFGYNYVEAKARAEQIVLAAVAKGLSGKVIRVGNIVSRAQDGEFKTNLMTYGFMNEIQKFAKMGKFPVQFMDSEVEFSFMTETAKAIMMLSGADDRYTVFHACSSHPVHMANVIYAMQKNGMEIEISKEITKENANINLAFDNSFTTKALYRLGFAWPIMDEGHLQNALDVLEKLGFFG